MANSRPFLLAIQQMNILEAIMDSKVLSHLTKHNAQQATVDFLSQPKQMYVDGEWINAQNDERIVSYDPCYNAEITSFPAASTTDLDKAICAARRTLDSKEWSEMLPLQRESLMHKLANLIEEHADVLAEIEALDAGKAISGCREADIAGSIDVLRYFAGWPSKIEGSVRQVSVPGEHIAMAVKEPVGVVGGIVPWNWPFNMMMWKFSAAIAAGCTLVLKPAQQTSLSAIYFAKLVEQAGFPAGVFNLVTGKGSVIGNELVSHPLISKVSFTGSTPVGKQVGALVSQNLSHVTLELGGKSPMVVFEDADIERVVAATQQSVFFNSGQVCSAGSRMYVQRKIYEDVIAAVAAKTKEMKLGLSLDESTEMGPIISSGQFASIIDYISIGQREGARLVCGGKAEGEDGFFIQPTVFADCTNAMRIVREEIFGPVLSIQPFDTEEQAIQLANDNEYGLAASVFSQDTSRVWRCSKQIKAGTVWINTHDLVDPCMPFGGFKNSGLGKDLGPEALEQFLQTKTVWLEL
ncbi:MAG: aldehyde dehydrogenase family protein [Colwellia sp.]|jgi:NAD-dependent aldehyde dehydrogenases